MNNDEDIFIFPKNDDGQLNLDFGASMDDTITIKMDDLMTTSITTSGTMASGSLLTAGTGSLTWTLPTSLNNGYTITSSLPTAVNSTYTYDTITLGNGAWDTNSKGLTVKGDAEFEGDIKIKGVNLTDRLDEIEKRLAILRPNNDLEGKWEKLKTLGEEYRKLEKEILEGESIWDILKK
jgi:hypothetical protein